MRITLPFHVQDWRGEAALHSRLQRFRCIGARLRLATGAPSRRSPDEGIAGVAADGQWARSA
eukprot:6726658-Pyramimonas_sp.AAC.1